MAVAKQKRKKKLKIASESKFGRSRRHTTSFWQYILWSTTYEFVDCRCVSIYLHIQRVPFVAADASARARSFFILAHTRTFLCRSLIVLNEFGVLSIKFNWLTLMSLDDVEYGNWNALRYVMLCFNSYGQRSAVWTHKSSPCTNTKLKNSYSRAIGAFNSYECVAIHWFCFHHQMSMYLFRRNELYTTRNRWFSRWHIHTAAATVRCHRIPHSS